jgi:hypothetical protein
MASKKNGGGGLKVLGGIVAILIILGAVFFFYPRGTGSSANATRAAICAQNPSYCNATVVNVNNASASQTTSASPTTTVTQTSSYGCAPIPCSFTKNGNFTFLFTLPSGAVDTWYFPVTTYNYYVSAPKYTPSLLLSLSNGTKARTTDYRAMVTPSFFANVTPALTNGHTAEQFLQEVLSIKNQLTIYSTVFENTSVYPAVILGSGEGDCKDFGVLMASIIEAGNIQANYGMQVQFVYVDAYNLSTPKTADHLILHINFDNGTSQFIDTTQVFNTTPGGPPPTIGGWYFNLSCTMSSCQAGNQQTTPSPTYTGTLCIAYSGYACLGESLSAGKLSVTVGQSTGSAFYNTALACVAKSQPIPTSNSNQFYSLSNPTLNNGQTESTSGMPCAGTTAGGSTFKGSLWMEFTANPGAPTAQGGSNPFLLTQLASLYVNASS